MMKSTCHLIKINLHKNIGIVCCSYICARENIFKTVMHLLNNTLSY